MVSEKGWMRLIEFRPTTEPVRTEDPDTRISFDTLKHQHLPRVRGKVSFLATRRIDASTHQLEVFVMEGFFFPLLEC